MATKDFLLADLGEGLTEGEIVTWLVAVGDVIEIDQPVVEVETAKAVVEVPTPFEGTVTALHAAVGDEVEVGKPLMTIDVGGADGHPDAGSVPDEAEVADMVPEPDAAAPPGDGGDGQSGSVLVGYGTGTSRRRRRRGAGRVPQAPPARPDAGPSGPAPRPAAAPAGAGGRPLAKPPVRKRAKDLGIDLATVEGTGPGGLITRDDVEALAGNGAQAPTTTPGHEAAAAEEGREERVPLRGVRKVIAQKMTTSRQEIPEATSWVDVDATALLGLRDDLNADQDDVKVSPLAIILRACVAGLRRYPQLNSRLDVEAQEIVVQRHVNLGVAAQTDRGLVVPVIKDAQRRSTLELARELGHLAQRARDGALTPEQMSGGTFSVSNYGVFGVDGGAPVINHPEAAILGVGRITDRPWVVDGQLAVRKVCQLSVAFDHRLCDGAEAAGFLRFVADCMERPAKLLASL